MWAIHHPNVGLTFWSVTIFPTQIPNILIRAHLMQPKEAVATSTLLFQKIQSSYNVAP